MSLKSLVYKLIAFAGVGYLQKKLKSKLTIVMYHSVVKELPPLYDWCYVDAESFRQQVRFLKKNFEVINLSQVAERLISEKTEKPLAVITFDDGYQNNFDVAFPILKEEGVGATIFLTTDLINTDDTLWVCRLHHALSNTKKTEIEWDGNLFNISDNSKKTEFISLIKRKLKKMSISQSLPQLETILNQAGFDRTFSIERDSLYRLLDDKSIHEMNQSGLIEFGAHTMSHEILSCLPFEEQEKEIEGSIHAVSKLTGKNCNLFAYPNGSQEDYNDNTLELLKKYGIKVSVTTVEKIIDSHSSMLELGRYSIGYGMDMAYFKLLVLNFIALSKGLRRSH